MAQPAPEQLTLFATEHFRVRQSDEYRIPGYLFVESLVGREQLADLAPGEAHELGDCLVAAEALVGELLAPERVYLLRFSEAERRLHVHVFPRTRRIAAAYLEDEDDRPPYNGARLIAWAWRRHAALGFSDDHLRDFVAEARDWALRAGLRSAPGSSA